jgi:hypothetical protein
VVVVVVELVVVVVELVVVVVVVGGQGFGVQPRNAKKIPPLSVHAARVSMVHWSKGPPGVLCLQHAEGGAVEVVVLVVEVVVVVIKLVVVVMKLVVLVVETGVVVVVIKVVPHAGSAGFVQEQNVSPLLLHSSRINFLQALKSAPDKLPHAASISSAQGLLPQSGGAAPAPETKPPAASATANNVTTAFLVIVEPPQGRPMPKIDFGALPPR